jgi:hypothetical protein
VLLAPPVPPSRFSPILEELESERRWDELFQRSADTLAKLAKEALAEDRAGRTKPLDDLL